MEAWLIRVQLKLSSGAKSIPASSRSSTLLSLPDSRDAMMV